MGSKRANGEGRAHYYEPRNRLQASSEEGKRDAGAHSR